MTWFQDSVTRHERQLRDAVAYGLADLVRADRADPTSTALDVVDNALARAAADVRRTGAWSSVVDVLLDYRLNVMADRDRGYRVVERRRLTNALRRRTDGHDQDHEGRPCRCASASGSEASRPAGS